MKFYSTLLAFIIGFSLYGQTNDCDMAQVVCSDETIVLNPNGPGDDDFANPNNDQGCLVAGEINTGWFYIEFSDDMPPLSVFGFIINPLGGLGEDYDWALYGPDVNCADLGSPIRCSSSSQFCDFCPQTGMGMGAMDVTEGPGTGDGFVSTLLVNPGQGYYLVIDNWAATMNGFELKWEGEAAEYLNCDAEPPCAHAAFAGEDLERCKGDGAIFLSGDSEGTSGIETYTWTGDGAQYLINPNVQNPVANVPNDFIGILEFILTVLEGTCEDSDTMFLTIYDLPEIQIVPVGPFCPDEPPLAMAANPTGGNWSGAAPFGIFDPEFLGPGLHTVVYTYTDANNCENSEEIIIEVWDAPETIITPDPAEFCEEEEFILVFASGNNGDGDYNFSWQGPSGSDTGDTYTANEPGNHFVTVTDGNGCSGTGEVEVIEYPTPLVIINDPGAICQSTNVTNLSGAPPGGTWSGTIISSDGLIFPSQEDVGTYTVIYTYTDDNDCTGMEEMDIEIVESPVAAADNSGPYCNGNSFELYGDAGGNTGVNYVWTGPNGYTSTEQNPSDAVDSGYYYLQISLGDCLSPVDSTQVIISDGLIPDANAENSGPYCAGETIELLGETTSSGSTIIYEWTGPNGYTSNQQNPTDATESGDYSLVITIDDCPSDPSITEVQYTSAIDATANNNGPFCLGEAVDLTGSTTASGNNIIYQWVGPNGYTSNDQNPTDITDSGTYELVINIDGCDSELASTEVVINSLPSIAITGDDSACEGSTLPLDAGGPFDIYSWSTGEDSQTIEINTSDTYSVTVTDSNGCTGEALIDVEIFQNPNPNITGSSSFCIGSSTTLGLDQSYVSYTWSDNSNSPTIEVTSPGMVSVTVTDANNCAAETFIDVIESTSLNPLIAGDLSFCPGGSTMLDAGSGFLIYNWSSGETDQVISIDQPGNYTVTVEDGGGCSGENTVSVALLNPPIAQIDGPLTICEGESTTLSANNDALVYSWTNGDETEEIQVNAGGMYGVTITDSNGCTGEETVIVTLNPNPVPVISGIDNICIGDNTTINAGSGYTDYTWSNGSDQQMLTTNMPGVYVVTVTDLNNCTGTDEIEIFENPSPIAEISGEFDFCEGGSVVLSGMGGNSLDWSTGSNDQSIEVSSEGTIQLTVIDANGCTNMTSVDITMYPNPSPEIEGTTTLCSGNSVFINTIQNFESYSWSDGSGDASLEVFGEGTYRVTVTDINGCTGETEVFIEEVESLSPIITGNVSFCFESSSVLQADAGYNSYEWSTGQATSNITVDASGTYTVTVSDADGCTGESLIDVIEFPPVDLNLGPDQVVQLGETTTVTASANIPESEIDVVIWSPAEFVTCMDPKCTEVSVSTNSILNLQATIVSLDGCEGQDDVTIRVEKDQRVYFPTVFSPNDDGVNDYFFISAKEGRIANISKFRIFDRWGEMVFSAENLQANSEMAGWNGKFNNKTSLPGVYVFFAEIEFADGDVLTFNGDVSIVK